MGAKRMDGSIASRSVATTLLVCVACSASNQKKTVDLPKPAVDLQEETEGATAVFAGGCFWCVEAVFEQLAGVEEVVSGYAGGAKGDANYDDVSAGTTDHAEAVRVRYDPAKITYGQLLRVFLSTHDPTQLNRQGPDWGRQYRSAIFYASDDQKRVAQRYIDQLRGAKVFAKPIVTTLEPLGSQRFFVAEAYHQDYVRRNPGNAYVRRYALPKVKKARERFAEWIK